MWLQRKGRAHGHGKECGFYSENGDQSMKGFKQGSNII